MSQEVFNDVTNPDELKLLTLQFIGQHVSSSMKAIDQAIISPNSNLRASNLNAKAIIDTIPSPNIPNKYTTTVNAGINVEKVFKQPAQQQAEPIIQNDPNQLEFDFNNCNYAKLIFDRLDSIDRKLSKLLDN